LTVFMFHTNQLLITLTSKITRLRWIITLSCHLMFYKIMEHTWSWIR